MARGDSKAQMGLSQDGAGPDSVWLEPSKGGYVVKVGASRPGEHIGFLQKDSDGAVHINRLDLMEQGFGTYQEAAAALVAKLREEGKL